MANAINAPSCGPPDYEHDWLDFCQCQQCTVSGGRSDVRFRADYVRSTPKADVRVAVAELPLMTRMYGPTVRCNGEFGDGQAARRR